MDSKCMQGEQLGVDGVIRIVFVISGIPKQYYSGGSR